MYNDGGIMIILHNHQLQNQCFRPSTHERTASHTPHLDSSHPPQVIELRKSYSSASPIPKKQSNNQSKEKSKFQHANWMADHFLGDVKQRFKEIYKQRHQNDEQKRPTASPRKNSTHSNRKLLNLSVNCGPAVMVDKQMLFRNPLGRSGKSKRLIDVRRGKLFKGTQRDYNQFIRKQMSGENALGSGQMSQKLLEEEAVDEEELEESYLQSQYAIMQRRREEKEEGRIRTEKRTIEPAAHQLSLNKYESEMLASSLKRRSPALYPQDEAEPNDGVLSQIRSKFINEEYFSVRKRDSLTRRQERKRPFKRQFKSKASLQLNLDP